ncbi:MAG: alanine:cation symporter family protein [Planctomycetaceae bacterium]|nr:alanine:cation symporter family protein [Planctomycetaceae bacterium]
MQKKSSAGHWASAARWAVLGALVFGLSCISLPNVLGQEAGAASSESAPTTAPAVTDAAAASETASSPAPTSTQPVEGEKNAEAAPKKPRTPEEKWAEKEKTWIGKIDNRAGYYVVDPMSAVLFFDFGTEKLLGVKIPFVVLWLLCGGVFLTIKMGFINFRGFKHGLDLVMGKYDDPKNSGEVSHFQALASALSGTVGLGNIAGVAAAIGLGGPGATFWMILCGLLGMTSKFAECSLAVMYRRVGTDGTVLGGPMVYLKDGLAKMGLGKLGGILAIVFAVLCVGGSFGGGNSYQIVQSLNTIKADPNLKFLETYPWIYGLLMVVAVGVVILGGIKSIGRTAEKIVPVMCLAYLLMAFVVIGLNFSRVPLAIQQIFEGAFTPGGMAGGFLGVMVIGIKRAVFSNEAGAGSAAIAHSAAKTDRPMSEGFVALLEPFIDTVVVCTVTAVMIVVTGLHATPEVQALASDGNGAQITLKAVTQNAQLDWFRYVLYFSVVLFAYSTCISWSYYGERCFVFLFGPRSSLFYKVLFLTFTFLGSVVSADKIMDFSDMLILSMSVPNLIGVFLMSGVIKRSLDAYLLDLKNGKIVKH